AFICAWHQHFWGHYCAGGDMQNLDRAPNCPLFWCWHAFVDEIYSDWIKETTDPAVAPPVTDPPFDPATQGGGTKFKTEPPAQWPWPGPKPDGYPASGDLVSVPWLYGNTQEK